MRGGKLLFPLMLASLAFSCLAAAGPRELPDWFIAALGLVLPWLFATFVSKLPAWSRAPVCYGLAAAVGIVAGFAWCGWVSIGDVLKNVVWLWATMQFVYELMVRKTVARLSGRRASSAASDSLRKLP